MCQHREYQAKPYVRGSTQKNSKKFEEINGNTIFNVWRKLRHIWLNSQAYGALLLRQAIKWFFIAWRRSSAPKACELSQIWRNGLTTWPNHLSFRWMFAGAKFATVPAILDYLPLSRPSRRDIGRKMSPSRCANNLRLYELKSTILSGKRRIEFHIWIPSFSPTGHAHSFARDNLGCDTNGWRPQTTVVPGLAAQWR